MMEIRRVCTSTASLSFVMLTKWPGDYWLNTQIREMKFVSETDEAARLEETASSSDARKKGGSEI